MSILLIPSFVRAFSTNFKIEIVAVCGNGIIESGEQCDTGNLGISTCQTRGFSAGTLSCNNNCTFNTSLCTNTSGGGGGGGGGGSPRPDDSNTDTRVTFSGRAYPMSKVGVLKDGQLALTTIAGPDAKFSMSLSGLSSGNYTFSVFGEDDEGRRSSLFTFPVFITRGATTNVSGIFITPTIAVDKSEVRRGDNLIIFGKGTPNGTVTIEVNSENQIFLNTKTDTDGAYLYTFDTSPLYEGSHSTKAKIAQGAEVSSFSNAVGFLVGNKNVFIDPVTQKRLRGDVNYDNRVNLLDFSITAYWYKRVLNADFREREKNVLNADGVVDLRDFSILAYYWTG